MILDTRIAGDHYSVDASEPVPGLAVFEVTEEDAKRTHADYPSGWRVAHTKSGMLAFGHEYAFESREKAFEYCTKIEGLADYTASIKVLNGDLVLIENLQAIEKAELQAHKGNK